MEVLFVNTISEFIKSTKIVKNLSRQKMLILTVCAIIRSRSVVLPKLALLINDKVKTSSNETRLRDFFREVDIDYTELAKFTIVFLATQSKGKIRLTIDRTNWEFGEHSINILMIIASNGNYNIPLFWELLDNKGGNSNCEQRNNLLQKCIDLVGANRIGLVLGDREFIGQKWIKFLKTNKIPFCVRVPKSHYIQTANGEILSAETIGKNRNQTTRFDGCMVDGVWASAVVSKDAKGELLFLFGTANVLYLEQFYERRWTIETLFQSLKSRGFDLEQTHISSNERIKKLIALVSMAYALCCSMGIFRHEYEKSIEIKKHKRKANSFFRHGLNFIADGFKVGYKYQKQWLELFSKYVKFIFVKNSLSTA
jgi:Transposase DDE domain